MFTLLSGTAEMFNTESQVTKPTLVSLPLGQHSEMYLMDCEQLGGPDEFSMLSR